MAAATNGPPQEVQQAIRHYQELMQDSQRLASKISELEMDSNEHRLVEETLQPLDPSRRAYRLVGSILVERNVSEVLPSVATNRENVGIVLLSTSFVPIHLSSRIFLPPCPD